MNKKILYSISFQNTDGTLGSADPSFWTGKIGDLVARLEKTEHEQWSGEKCMMSTKKVAWVKVARTITEDVATFGERLRGERIKVGTDDFLLSEDNAEKVRSLIQKLTAPRGGEEGL